MPYFLDIPYPPYSLKSVTSHGWYLLAPHQFDFETETFSSIERLTDGMIIAYTIRQQGERLQVEVAHSDLSPEHWAELSQKLRWMLSLDEDFTSFFDLCRQQGPPWVYAADAHYGRFLRSATMFEDVVKTICTTNINWAQTKAMVSRIVETLGNSHPSNSKMKAFPTAEQVHAAPDEVFDHEIRLGYRNSYIKQLAAEVVAGTHELERLKQADLDSKTLRKRLKQIKGVGNYAAHTLLMLSGRYDQLAIDSELKAFMSERYQLSSEKVTPQVVAEIYNDWGKWKYLAYWYDSHSSWLFDHR